MNSIVTRRALSSTTKFAGQDFFYEFRDLGTTFDEKACAKAANELLERYAKTTKGWTPERNSEWLCRFYMSAKLIMSATLHVNSERYAKNRNLRAVEAYLRYYSVLSLLRSVCYTLPELAWKNGELIRISHNSAIAETISHLRAFSRPIADNVEQLVRLLKAERELISYRAPSVGDDQVSTQNNFLWLCTLLAEVAQFNSELFDTSLTKHADPKAFVLLPEYASRIATIQIDDYSFDDREDAYRLDYLSRKFPRPTNLQHMMTEGHVEDFFGAWCAEEPTGDMFDPDDMQGIIFDIP